MYGKNLETQWVDFTTQWLPQDISTSVKTFYSKDRVTDFYSKDRVTDFYSKNRITDFWSKDK